MLHILSDKKRRAFYEWNTGRKATVIFENDFDGDRMHGFTENYIRIAAKYDPLIMNEPKKVRLTGINEKGLMEVEESESEVYVL